MSSRTWVLLLLFPAPLYVAGRLLLGFSLGSMWIPLGFAVTVSFGVVAGLGILRASWLVATGLVALLLAVILPLVPPFPARMEGLDLATGVMLGLPLVGLAGAGRDDYPPAVRFGALELALFMGIWYLAALPGIAASGSILSGYDFFEALSGVLGAQAQGLAALFSAGGSTTVLPLGSALDPVFVGLAGLALLGIMITTLVPRTALGEPLPWAWTMPRRLQEELSTTVPPEELREGQKTALRGRSHPMAPDVGMPPGVESLILAGFAMVLVVLGALYLPMYFLLALTLAVTTLVIVVAASLTQRLGTPVGAPSAGGGESPPPPAPPPTGRD